MCNYVEGRFSWTDVVDSAIEALTLEFARLKESERLTYDAMIDAPSRMESRYDTRREDEGLNLGRIKADIVITRNVIEVLSELKYASMVPGVVQRGSLVIYSAPWGIEYALIVPVSVLGFEVNGFSIQLISGNSPNGAALIGCKKGDSVKTVAGSELKVEEVLP